MEINAIQNQFHQPLQEAQNMQKAPKAEATAETEQADASSKTQDQYIPSTQTPPAGIYHPTQDADGKMRISYDGPAPAADGDRNGKTPNAASDKIEDEKTEQCTVNTDKIDQEIQRLKQEKQQLEQQIAMAKEDPQKSAALENQLADIENQLKQKDNDAYRKQHAVVS